MLLRKAVLALAWAATAAVAAPANGYADMNQASDGAGPSNEAAEKGGLQRFQIVTDYMSPGSGLARSSAPYYDGSDTHQKITPDTIAAFKKYGINHVISANHAANDETIKKALEDAGIAYTPLPVADFTASSQQDFQTAWDAFVAHRDNGTTLVWCGYGHGRTGTMISALQMFAEHERNQLHEWTHEDYDQNYVEEQEQEDALNELQNRLREQPPPGPTAQQLSDLEEGNFYKLNCVVILASMLYHQHLSHRSMLRGVAMLSRRQVTPEPTYFDCERAQHILQKQNVPVTCQKIKNIQLGIAFSNDYWSGSWDDIGATLEGPAGKATLHVQSQPERGFHTWATVDMQASYNAEEIDVNGIDKITLNAAGIANQPMRLGGNSINDEWQVQDIQIRADCADPGFEAKDDKLVGLNAWYGHPGGWFWDKLTKKTVATFPIVPSDWAFSPPCAIIKELSYNFQVANWYYGGTSDSLAFSISDGKRIELGENIEYNYNKKGEINLKDVFGKDEVDIRDLKDLNIIDNGSGDQWAYEGLTLYATCAHNPKKMALKKYQSVNKWIEHVETGPAWTGPIVAADWIEVV